MWKGGGGGGGGANFREQVTSLQQEMAILCNPIATCPGLSPIMFDVQGKFVDC